ncbi:MAG: peptidylprolyl isomerase [Deltaproteobacteria bacterium]|nr:peptidylprolyl isomerase [Deltaproteobacteria bacterium]
MRIGTMALLVALPALAGSAACKKKSEDQGGSAGPAPAASEDRTVDGSGGADLQPGESPQAGLVDPGAATTPPPSTPAATTPAETPAPTGEVPRTLPCPRNRQTWEPTSPDPEAGDFTLEEALAGLPGGGQPVATIETSLGTLTCRLAGDLVPVAVANFVGLARGLRPWWDPCRAAWVREPYYDGLTWHRVIPTFMAQGGDPFGDGSGGPGYTFANEQRPELLHDRPGTLAYANAGRDTNGSQFYITVGRRPQLDGGYVVFGYCDNVAVVEQIVAVPRDVNDRPLQPVLIRRITIAREG